MSDTETKSQPASQRKLQKQREQGIVARAANLGSYLALIASCGVLLFLMPSLVRDTMAIFDTIYDQMSDPFGVSSANALQDVGQLLLKLLLPVVAAGLSATVLANILNNKGILASLSPLAPKLERVSPMTGLKRIYGRRGWIELGVSLVSLLLWFGAVSIIMYTGFAVLLQLNECNIACIGALTLRLVLPLGITAAILFLLFAGFDTLIQRNLFLHEQRMTETELKRERREQSSSPEMRKERKRRQRDDRESVGSVGIKAANMAFFWNGQAIAVRYHPTDAPLPRITAKAKTPEKTAALLEAVRANGHLAEENESVVIGNIKVEVGGPARKETFQDLAQGIQRMFGA